MPEINKLEFKWNNKGKDVMFERWVRNPICWFLICQGLFTVWKLFVHWDMEKDFDSIKINPTRLPSSLYLICSLFENRNEIGFISISGITFHWDISKISKIRIQPKNRILEWVNIQLLSLLITISWIYWLLFLESRRCYYPWIWNPYFSDISQIFSY